jgi:DNA polymerase
MRDRGMKGELSGTIETPMGGRSKIELLEELSRVSKDCQKCRLSRSRTQVVFGSGNPEAEVMFVGEAPGEEEDKQGQPFVGKAGQLLTKIIEAIKLRREDVYIANIVKCRPPGNRTPEEDETECCFPYLKQQIEILRPKVICALGRIAAQALLGTTASLGKIRGRIYQYGDAKVIVTYHPAALLRDPGLKRPTWEDMKILRKEYDGVEL